MASQNTVSDWSGGDSTNTFLNLNPDAVAAAGTGAAASAYGADVGKQIAQLQAQNAYKQTQLQSQTEQNVANTQAQASNYGALQAANASKYGAQQGNLASIYGSNAQQQASNYAAQMGLLGTKYTSNANLVQMLAQQEFQRAKFNYLLPAILQMGQAFSQGYGQLADPAQPWLGTARGGSGSNAFLDALGGLGSRGMPDPAGSPFMTALLGYLSQGSQVPPLPAPAPASYGYGAPPPAAGPSGTSTADLLALGQQMAQQRGAPVPLTEVMAQYPAGTFPSTVSTSWGG